MIEIIAGIFIGIIAVALFIGEIFGNGGLDDRWLDGNERFKK